MKPSYSLKNRSTAFVLLLAVFMIVTQVITASAQGGGKLLSGSCKDEKGAPMIGVAVTIPGTQQGVSTDLNGAFSIKAAENTDLEFRYVGYKTQRIKATQNMSVVMTPDNTSLEEIVVVGYGVQKRRDIVGAVETIKGDIISERKTANVSRALQGQIPGLTLTFSDGKPSRNATIRIRGVENSIGAGGSALVLVDGVETDMNTVNPDDIESITVLKDASSTAVYGAKGTFGVILITTKNPQDGRVRVTYDGSYSIFTRTTPIETVNNSVQWMDEFIEAYNGRYGKDPATVNNVLKVFDGGLAGYYAELKKRDADPTYEKYKVNSSGYWEYYGNNDWHDIVYRDWTSGQQHNLSISGGSEKAQFLFSGRYFQQDGIYNWGDEDYTQYNSRMKATIQISKWLKLDNNFSFMRRNIYQPRVAEGNQLIQRQIEIVGAPMIGAKNPDGTWTNAATYIGVACFEEGTTWDKYRKSDIQETIGLTADLLKDVLVARGEFGYFYNHTSRQRARNQLTYYAGPEITGLQPASSQYRDYDYDTNRWTASGTLTWTPKLGDAHSLTVMGGVNAEEYGVKQIYTYREGILFPDKVNPSFIEGDTFEWSDNGSSEYSLFGAFFRLHYGYKGRYLVEVSGRYDGNSKFPAGQRWGFFPSASVGWRISEEPFMASTRSWLDNLKLRVSAGTAGNGLISNAYAYMSLMGFAQSSAVVSGGHPFKYATAPTPVPDGLTWEKATTYDLGLDLEMLNGRFNLTADIYRRNTTDMYVVGAELPAVYGNAAPKGNYGDMQTDGWEASISWRDSFNAGRHPFGYYIRGAVWDSVSKITRYTSKNSQLPTIYSQSYYEGMTLGEIWGYHVAGLFESDTEAANWASQSKFKYFTGDWKAGDIKLADIDNSGVIDNGANTLADHGDLIKIGNTSPRYCYSITAGINWNGIGFSMMWQGVGKRDWYPAKDSGYFWGKNGRAYGYSLPWQDASNRYTDENQNVNAYWPRLRGYQAEVVSAILSNANDCYLQDACYLRLKNVTLDYTFPKRISQKLRMESLRIYVTGDNLCTFTPLHKWAKNYDPEGISAGDADFASTVGTNGDGYGYPVMRTVTIGVNVTF